MPTGYTAKLMEKGQTFPEFIMGCSRAFGAMIMMRDEANDAPIPERFEPSDFYAPRVAEAKAELARLQAMSKVDALAHGEELKVKALSDTRRYIRKEIEENARLDAMFEHVRAWKPPTPEHTGLKEFMLEQLQTSRHDVSYYERSLELQKAKSASVWHLEAVEAAEQNIKSYSKYDAEEVERTEGRNRWLAALRASI